ncbi:hypothetical protein CDD80_4066 [Ophiocordyceps camponoti-rufipedis]|uniref:FAR1 domain-containing protein n=1 Tax=Ophiocordyceps camponoti-rufipedis TaxID=2004952 RepID=A0A2C5Z0D0_9HYPO|nr:hypothetical protein CDD80_4066 [Ophiocordyceps camponoti-rufipedis]
MSSSTTDSHLAKMRKAQSLRRARTGMDSWDDEDFFPTTNVNNTNSSPAPGSSYKTPTSESNMATPDSELNPESPPFCPATTAVEPGASPEAATAPSASSTAAKFLEIAQLNWATAQAYHEASQLVWSAAMIQHRDMHAEPEQGGCNFLRAAGAPIPTTSDPDGPGYCPVRLGKETGYMWAPNVGVIMKSSQEFTAEVLSRRDASRARNTCQAVNWHRHKSGPATSSYANHNDREATSGVYASCEDLMRDLNSRAEKEGYKIVKARSDRSRPGGPIIRADLVCERGGRPYRCQATKHKTSTKKTNCPWKAKAVDRKLLGGWVLTIICDHHNHEPGTPEPPTPSEGSDVAEEESVRPEGPRPDDETAVALQVAGVSDAVLRLSGDTFHRFKGEYRKMSQPERLGILAQMQLRIAAIYAVQNEDMQRQKRQDAQDKRHREIEENKRRLEAGGLHSAKRLRGVPPAPSADESPSGGASGQRQYSRIAPAPTPAIQEPHFQPVPGATAEPTPQMSFQAYPGPPKRRRQSRAATAAAAQQQQQPAQQQIQQPPQQPQSQQQHSEPLATDTNAAVQAADSAKS